MIKYRVTYYRSGSLGMGIVMVGAPTTFGDIPAIVAKREQCAAHDILIASVTLLGGANRP